MISKEKASKMEVERLRIEIEILKRLVNLQFENRIIPILLRFMSSIKIVKIFIL